MNIRLKQVCWIIFLFFHTIYTHAQDNLPTIHIIGTGGTIAGAQRTEDVTSAGYTPVKVTIEDLLAAVPQLSDVANIEGEQLFQIASHDISLAQWKVLVSRVNELLARNDVDGIVITHGTDTLEESAYLLDLTVKSEKPVVLVGSMRPAGSLSADGPLNLFNAVQVAASPESKDKGVLVVLNGAIHAAREAAKTNTINVDTFKSPNTGKLGEIVYGQPYYSLTSLKPHTTNTPFNINKDTSLPRVDIMYMYAGNDRTQIDAFMDAGSQGIVIAGTGNGNVNPAILEALQEAVDKGIVVVRSSRVGSGIVGRNIEYDDDAYRFVVADDLNPQKARILLMLALLHTKDPQEIQTIFNTY